MPRSLAATARRDLEAAQALAADHYYLPDVAALLTLAAASPERSEQRIRAQAALRLLAFDHDLELLPGNSIPPAWARAVGAACTELALYLGHGLDRRERVAGLLVALCGEAWRVRGLRAAETA